MIRIRLEKVITEALVRDSLIVSNQSVTGVIAYTINTLIKNSEITHITWLTNQKNIIIPVIVPIIFNDSSQYSRKFFSIAISSDYSL